MSKFTVDGVRYGSAREAQRARRKKSLKNIGANRGVRSRLWNMFASKEKKKQAAQELESMR